MKRVFVMAVSLVTLAVLSATGGCKGKNANENSNTTTPVEMAKTVVQHGETIKLLPHSAATGADVMTALEQRKSAVGETIKGDPLSLEDLSDLLWAAYGINRPAEGKLTAPSSMNSQECEIFALFAEGTYTYSPAEHALMRVSEVDLRKVVTERQPEMSEAPLMLLVVGHLDKLRAGDDAMRRFSAAIDGGIVSQNVSIFCAAKGWKTRPRTSMNREELQRVLNLDSSTLLIVNHPVSY